PSFSEPSTKHLKLHISGTKIEVWVQIHFLVARPAVQIPECAPFSSGLQKGEREREINRIGHGSIRARRQKFRCGDADSDAGCGRQHIDKTTRWRWRASCQYCPRVRKHIDEDGCMPDLLEPVRLDLLQLRAFEPEIRPATSCI